MLRSRNGGSARKQIKVAAPRCQEFPHLGPSALIPSLFVCIPTAEDEATPKKNVVSIVESIACRLGNTHAVCQRCYIHPAIIDDL